MNREVLIQIIMNLFIFCSKTSSGFSGFVLGINPYNNPKTAKVNKTECKGFNSPNIRSENSIPTLNPNPKQITTFTYLKFLIKKFRIL